MRSALVAFGAKEKAPVVILSSLPTVLSFWILDASFKQFQRRYINRKTVIELFFSSEGGFRDNGLSEAFARFDFGGFPIHDPISTKSRMIGADFERKYRQGTKYWRAFAASNILSFYLLLILGTIAVAVSTLFSW